MPKYHYRGEAISEVLPAELEEVTFEGVTVSRLIGTKEQIRDSTDIFCKLYPKEFYSMDTMNDAKFMGTAMFKDPKGNRVTLDLYELIVLRKSHRGNNHGVG